MPAGFQGRVCLVTGATSGIGQETALGLARLGARVVLVGRDAERGRRAVEDVAARSGNPTVELMLADLASLDSVRDLADRVLSACPQLHVLVNNAGTVNLHRTTTVDGFETTFAVNHLAGFLLTHLLVGRLIASAPARIVNVASDAHAWGRFDDLQSERRYGAMRAYGTSKLCNIAFTYELARRLEGTGVTANCVHPGAVGTRLGHNNGAWARGFTALLKPFFLTPEQGARTTLHAVSAAELEGVTGKYFAKLRPRQSSRRSRRPDLARRLWEESEKLTGVAVTLSLDGGAPHV